MMQWFGESWGAPVCRECPRVATPVDRLCWVCHKPISEGDTGVIMPYFSPTRETMIAAHLDCFISTIFPHVESLTD